MLSIRKTLRTFSSLKLKIRNSFYPKKISRSKLFDYTPQNLNLNFFDKKKRDVKFTSKSNIVFIEVRANRDMFINNLEFSKLERKIYYFFKKSFSLKSRKILKLNLKTENLALYKRGILNRMGKGIGKFQGFSTFIYRNKLIASFAFVSKDTNYITNFNKFFKILLKRKFSANNRYYFQTFAIRATQRKLLKRSFLKRG